MRLCRRIAGCSAPRDAIPGAGYSPYMASPTLTMSKCVWGAVRAPALLAAWISACGTRAQCGDAQPGRAGCQGGPADRYDPVSIRIRFDHTHQPAGPRQEVADGPDVAGDGREVHLGPRPQRGGLRRWRQWRHNFTA